MLASAQAARMGQVDESQEEASTSEASSAHMQPWRHSSSSSSRATDTGILLADGEIGSEQHKIDKKRAIEKFFKEKEKRRRLGAWHSGILDCLCLTPLMAAYLVPLFTSMRASHFMLSKIKQDTVMKTCSA